MGTAYSTLTCQRDPRVVLEEQLRILNQASAFFERQIRTNERHIERLSARIEDELEEGGSAKDKAKRMAKEVCMYRKQNERLDSVRDKLLLLTDRCRAMQLTVGLNDTLKELAGGLKELERGGAFEEIHKNTLAFEKQLESVLQRHGVAADQQRQTLSSPVLTEEETSSTDYEAVLEKIKLDVETHKLEREQAKRRQQQQRQSVLVGSLLQGTTTGTVG